MIGVFVRRASMTAPAPNGRVGWFADIRAPGSLRELSRCCANAGTAVQDVPAYSLPRAVVRLEVGHHERFRVLWSPARTGWKIMEAFEPPKYITSLIAAVNDGAKS